MRLVLADDDPLTLDRLENLFSSEPDVTVVARCRTGLEALDAVRSHRPDVLVLEFRMPDMSAIEVMRAITQAQLPTASTLYTVSGDRPEILEALRLGVRGVVLKGMPPRLLVECVWAVHAGKYWLERNTSTQVLETLLRHEAGVRRLGDLLTDREIEIACEVANGLPNKAIAEKLRISAGTVKVHLHNIYEKLGLNSRQALTAYLKGKGVV